ncbi:glutathione S-transferase family protein [Elioraea sp.]|uniref:glutathione S-transferase family protein n=1 Tax=Elioraea sp. TaxID=2185103 RepID=UPI0025BA9F90|nr:glutathione S-transferase family protein [Elioraea sp.]
MGLLIDGSWTDGRPDAKGGEGRFVRALSGFRNWVTADGAPGPTGTGGFRAEPGRYHLYVAYACPWAHRTLIYRAIKGLDGMISISVVHWLMAENGWSFTDGPGVIPDGVNGARHIHEVYTKADARYTGRATVPVLWDKARGTIVSNESSEIIRMLNSAFDCVGAAPGDTYPESLRGEIDTLNERIYETVNNGVYKAGFATTKAAYEEAVVPLFETLDWLDARLATRRYLTGEAITEADWRLLPTLLRFDAVYVGHFKCNVRRIADYPNLSGYMRDLYAQPGIAETFNIDHAKRHYYESHRGINPTGIVPAGPMLDFTRPHGRDGIGA